VIQDYDHDGLGVWPKQPAIDRVIEAFRAAYRASGGDLWIGAKLPQLFAPLGAKTEVHPCVRAGLVDDPVWQWVERFLFDHVDTVVAGGHLTPAEREDFASAWQRVRSEPARFWFHRFRSSQSLRRMRAEAHCLGRTIVVAGPLVSEILGAHIVDVVVDGEALGALRRTNYGAGGARIAVVRIGVDRELALSGGRRRADLDQHQHLAIEIVAGGYRWASRAPRHAPDSGASCRATRARPAAHACAAGCACPSVDTGRSTLPALPPFQPGRTRRTAAERTAVRVVGARALFVQPARHSQQQRRRCHWRDALPTRNRF
jgi:hypothetical protein